MKAILEHKGQKFAVDFNKPIDISLEISNSESNPIAWYLDKPDITPVQSENWIGKVSEGTSSTNFNSITFNPHAHGTHTECLGHITRDFYSVNECLTDFHFLAELITVEPAIVLDDPIISQEQIMRQLGARTPEALIIRTLPNSIAKKSKNYSNSNPPYLDAMAAKQLCDLGIKHLLIDLPSVDKEKDNGALLAHKAFWNLTNIHSINATARLDATITEMIYVSNDIVDGTYLLNLQIASFKNDASPSKPILYKVEFLE